MSKKLRNLIIFIVIVLLLAGGAFLLFGTRPSERYVDGEGSLAADAALPLLTSASADMLAKNADSYAYYFAEDEFDEFWASTTGHYGGVGLYMVWNEEANCLMVNSAMKDTPAFDAKLQFGDLLVAVDGKDVIGVESETVVAMIKGEPDTSVTITVRREGEEDFDVTLNREIISVPSVEGQLLDKKAGIAYIRIDSFLDDTGTEFADVWNSLAEQAYINGLILDLRYNYGGSVDSALSVAAHFVPTGRVMMWYDDAEGSRSFTREGKLLDVPLLILQNEGSASASEIFIGACRDNGVAVTLGTQSFGKGIVQEVYELPSGAGVRTTVAKYRTPNGSDIHEIGIAPDIEVPWPQDVSLLAVYSVDPEKDVQLARGLEVIKEMISPSLPAKE